MKSKNTKSLLTLLAFAMAIFLILGSLTACGTSRNQEAPVREADELTRSELYEEIAALLDGEDHEFEREIAYRYYNDGERKNELSETERNKWMEEESAWGFDASGNGVFAVEVDAFMCQRLYFIEYSSDYGETWTSAGTYLMTTDIDDVKVAGERVVFSVWNGVTESGHNLVYSDDMCKSFRERDTIDFAPQELKAALKKEDFRIDMDLLGIEQSDGSVVLGWYKRTEPERVNRDGMNQRNYFLIGQTNADFTQMQVLSAAEVV